MELPNFEMVFEVKTDEYRACIGAVLMKEGKIIEYFSEKLSEAKRKRSTYEQELYAIV